MASVAEMSAAQCEQSECKCVRGERIPKIVANERVAPPSAFFL